MLVWSLIVIGVILLTLFSIKNHLLKGKCNAPKSPSGNWLTGNLNMRVENYSPTFLKWSKEIGSIFQFNVFPFFYPIVVINDVKMVKEMMNSRDFAGRSTSDAGAIGYNPDVAGVISQSPSPSWKELQRFIMSTLSSMGFGRAKMEIAVLEEADALTKALNNTNGKPIQVDAILKLSVSNVICKVVFGHRYELDEDSEIHSTVFDVAADVLHFGFQSLYNVGPTRLWMKLYKTERLKKFQKRTQWLKNYVVQSVDYHKKLLDEGHKSEDPQDLIEAFIMEQRRHPEATYLSENNIQYSVIDLFVAGTDTTATFLNWAFAWLLNFPDVRARLVTEVKTVLGDEGIPSMALQKEFHYLHAFVDEVQRRSSIVDFAVPHASIVPVGKIAGINIPQDKLVVPNIWACHHDPDVWERPMEFRPERFLDADGKYSKSENLIPFGIGHRKCLGEKLARMEIFIFTIRILQKIDFTLAPGSDLPPMFGQKPNFARVPENYKIVVNKKM